MFFNTGKSNNNLVSENGAYDAKNAKNWQRQTSFFLWVIILVGKCADDSLRFIFVLSIKFLAHGHESTDLMVGRDTHQGLDNLRGRLHR